MHFEERCGLYRSAVEKFLQEYIASCHAEPQHKLYEAMEYSLMAGGKRIRPILVMEFCRVCGGDWQKAVPFAAALEMIHTYSLIHDDLPCMDNDDYRRGRLTSHKVFGEGLAVLAGDALLTDAFMTAANAELPAQRVNTALSILSRCAGSCGMVGGQVLDIESESRLCTEQEILDVQIRKTGALIRAACQLGVLAGGGTQTQLEAAGKFADKLGLAFQIRDDMLDVIGRSEELGKAVGVDAGKNTFVRLYGIDRCGALVDSYTSDAVLALVDFSDTAFLKELSERLTSRTK